VGEAGTFDEGRWNHKKITSVIPRSRDRVQKKHGEGGRTEVTKPARGRGIMCGMKKGNSIEVSENVVNVDLKIG